MKTLCQRPTMVPLYQPKERPMHLILFGSGTGSNCEALLRAQKEDPNSLFSIKAIVTDRRCRMQKIAERENIPCVYFSFQNFLNGKNITDELRREYDRELLFRLLESSYHHRFSIDFIALTGYMRIITPLLLQVFSHKMINVHPADLAAVDPKGARLYVGKDAVAQAIYQGEDQTRSTVHLVTAGVDEGPILTYGPWVPFTEPTKDREAIERHQEKQKRQSDWPALIEAIRLISQGKIGITQKGQLVSFED